MFMDSKKHIYYIIENLKNIIKGKSEDWIKKNYPDLHSLIISIPYNISFTQKKYYYFSNLTEIPKCKCGKNLNFIDGEKGWRIYCSTKCQSNDSIIKEKRINTNINKYGVDNPSKLDIIKEKTRLSNLDKYGVDNPSKLDEIKNKVKLSNNKKFGCDYISQTKKVSDILSLKMKENSKLLFSSKKEKSKIKIINKVKSYDIIFIDIIKTSVYKFIHLEHEFIIGKNMLNDRIKSNTTICTICNKINNGSDSQKQVFNFIKENYNGIINYNDNKIIYPLELDIFLPELNIGIEYNGDFWHSDKFKDKNYHYNKYLKCKNNNIRLIQINEYYWNNKKDIIKSIILDSLNIYLKKINIYDCLLKNIKEEEKVNNFLLNNYIDGNIKYDLCIGIIFNNEIIGVILNINNDIIICKKIFYFIDNIEYIYSNYTNIRCNLSYEDDYLYEKLGFKYFLEEPSFSYYNNYKVYNSGYKIFKINL